MKRQINRVVLLVCYSVLAILLTGQMVLAQDAPASKIRPPQYRAQYQTNFMKSKLQLDTVQTTKVQAINLKYALKIEAILKSDDIRLVKYWHAIPLQKAKNSELKAVLTPDQCKQYEKIEDELKGKMKEMAGY